MRVCFAALIFLMLSCASCQLTLDQENKIFNEYLVNFFENKLDWFSNNLFSKRKYKIRLGRSDDIERSKRILIDRYNSIEDHNQKFRSGEISYELTLNEYSIRSDDEWIKQRTGLLPKPSNCSDGTLPAEQDKRRNGRASPVNWDWRSVSGVVRPVQNQGEKTKIYAWRFYASRVQFLLIDSIIEHQQAHVGLVGLLLVLDPLKGNCPGLEIATISFQNKKLSNAREIRGTKSCWGVMVDGILA